MTNTNQGDADKAKEKLSLTGNAFNFVWLLANPASMFHVFEKIKHFVNEKLTLENVNDWYSRLWVFSYVWLM